MGYYVESVAMIGADDPHGYFAFFVPSPLNEHQWVNEYFRTHFFDIAKALGSDGVFVASSRAARDVVAEFADLCGSNKLRPADLSAEEIFLSGDPLLVVTRYPIAALATRTQGAEANCVALRLSAVADERALGALLDAVIAAGTNGAGDILGSIDDAALSQLRPLARKTKAPSRLRKWTRPFKVKAPMPVPGVQLDLSEVTQIFDKHQHIRITGR
jgi:hypothetical protein